METGTPPSSSPTSQPPPLHKYHHELCDLVEEQVDDDALHSPHPSTDLLHEDVMSMATADKHVAMETGSEPDGKEARDIDGKAAENSPEPHSAGSIVEDTTAVYSELQTVDNTSCTSITGDMDTVTLQIGTEMIVVKKQPVTQEGSDDQPRRDHNVPASQTDVMVIGAGEGQLEDDYACSEQLDSSIERMPPSVQSVRPDTPDIDCIEKVFSGSDAIATSTPKSVKTGVGRVEEPQALPPVAAPAVPNPVTAAVTKVSGLQVMVGVATQYMSPDTTNTQPGGPPLRTAGTNANIHLPLLPAYGAYTHQPQHTVPPPPLAILPAPDHQYPPQPPPPASDHPPGQRGTVPMTSYRKRTFVGPEALNILEAHYLEDPYPSAELKNTLSVVTNLPLDSIKRWYQNRRNTERRHIGLKGQRLTRVKSSDSTSTLPVLDSKLVLGTADSARPPSRETLGTSQAAAKWPILAQQLSSTAPSPRAVSPGGLVTGPSAQQTPSPPPLRGPSPVQYNVLGAGGPPRIQNPMVGGQAQALPAAWSAANVPLIRLDQQGTRLPMLQPRMLDNTMLRMPFTAGRPELRPATPLLPSQMGSTIRGPPAASASHVSWMPTPLEEYSCTAPAKRIKLDPMAQYDRVKDNANSDMILSDISGEGDIHPPLPVLQPQTAPRPLVRIQPRLSPHAQTYNPAPLSMPSIPRSASMSIPPRVQVNPHQNPVALPSMPLPRAYPAYNIGPAHVFPSTSKQSPFIENSLKSSQPFLASQVASAPSASIYPATSSLQRSTISPRDEAHTLDMYTQWYKSVKLVTTDAGGFGGLVTEAKPPAGDQPGPYGTMVLPVQTQPVAGPASTAPLNPGATDFNNNETLTASRSGEFNDSCKDPDSLEGDSMDTSGAYDDSTVNSSAFSSDPQESLDLPPCVGETRPTASGQIQSYEPYHTGPYPSTSAATYGQYTPTVPALRYQGYPYASQAYIAPPEAHAQQVYANYSTASQAYPVYSTTNYAMASYQAPPGTSATSNIQPSQTYKLPQTLAASASSYPYAEGSQASYPAIYQTKPYSGQEAPSAQMTTQDTQPAASK